MTAAALPSWKGSPFGNQRYWTRERVLEQLRGAAEEIEGPLPCRDRAWSELKKSRPDWPPATRILEYFGGMGRAWLAAGADRSRVSLKNLDWTAEEDAYLVEWAGIRTLASIAQSLGRSYQATRARIGGKGMGITARANQGYLSAAELAKEYRTPYHRVRQLLEKGTIPGTYDSKRNRWQVDPGSITPELAALLKAPKVHSYKSSPPDLGDYYERYGLKRAIRDGRLVVVETGGPR